MRHSGLRDGITVVTSAAVAWPVHLEPNDGNDPLRHCYSEFSKDACVHGSLLCSSSLIFSDFVVRQSGTSAELFAAGNLGQSLATYIYIYIYIHINTCTYIYICKYLVRPLSIALLFFLGRPLSRMRWPDHPGRESWDWVEQEALNN